MSWLLGILAGCVVAVFVVAARWLGRAHAEPLPPAGVAPEARSARRPRPLRGARGPQGEPYAGRCVLCQAPLPSHFVTREEVIARVEHLIDADTAAVASLLAASPDGAWPRSIRP
jgi:hypothetical protein